MILNDPWLFYLGGHQAGRKPGAGRASMIRGSGMATIGARSIPSTAHRPDIRQVWLLMRNMVLLYCLVECSQMQAVKTLFMMIRGNGMEQTGRRFFHPSAHQLVRTQPCSLIQHVAQR